MAHRIRLAALIASVVAIALFALPLAFAAHRIYLADANTRLEQAALRAAVTIDPTLPPQDRPDKLGSTEDTTIGLYDRAGRLISGEGPQTADAPVRIALRGGSGTGRTNGDLVVAVPLSAGERVVGAVRAEGPMSTVWRRTLLTWLAMLALALLAVLGSVLVARAQARRINRPLEDLATASQALGDGDFAVRTEPAGIPEVDRAGAALNATAQRLGELIARERTFADNASHQLRTPLTGLRLRLETSLAAPRETLQSAAEAAIASADALEQTIDDLLAHARGSDPSSDGPPTDVERLLDELRSRRVGPLAEQGRRLVVHVEPGATHAQMPEYALRQTLEVLVDNAAEHGRGTVTISTRESAGALAIDVDDEGAGITMSTDEVFARGRSGGTGHGIGLAMARDLVEANGGRLILARRSPATTFTVLARAPQ